MLDLTAQARLADRIATCGGSSMRPYEAKATGGAPHALCVGAYFRKKAALISSYSAHFAGRS